MTVRRIQHVGYHVGDMDKAIAWFTATFNGKLLGQGPTDDGGRSAFVQSGDIIVELTETADKATAAAQGGLILNHVGYEVDDIDEAMREFKKRGMKFAADGLHTNVMGWKLIYFDSAGTMGTRIHLVQP